MKDYLPLLVAFLGAGIGAYFAILKSKTERLWLERYESLRAICEASNTLIHHYEAAQLEDYGLRVMSDQEQEKLSENVLKSKSELRVAIARAKLLFSAVEAKEIETAYTSMNGAITKVMNAHPSEYRADNFEDVAVKAKVLLEAAINLARNKIL